jgi:hypothetical protein
VLRLLFCSIGVLVLTAIAAGAQTQPAAPPVPQGGTSVLPANPLDALTLEGSQKQLATVTKVPVPGQPSSTALRVGVTPGAASEWNVQLASRTDKPIARGDVLLGRFWLRCTESMTGDGFVGFVFEQAGGDFAKSAQQRFAAGGRAGSGRPSRWPSTRATPPSSADAAPST